jgi:hypothetical protein
MSAEQRSFLLARLAERVSKPGKTILLASVVLFVLAAGSLVFSRGRTVVLSTNTAGATVQIDGRPGRPLTDTSFQFDRVPFGTREAWVFHPDFLPRQEPLGVGPFGGGNRHLEMERRKVRLIVQTLPGAEVLLDGRPLGKADATGVFSNSDVPAGDYSMIVRLQGYEEWQATAALHENETTIRTYLQMTPERRAELSRQRDRAFELLIEAESLFNSRNYRAALAAVDEAIRLNPEDGRAAQLRQRIVEIMQILQ